MLKPKADSNLLVRQTWIFFLDRFVPSVGISAAMTLQRVFVKFTGSIRSRVTRFAHTASNVLLRGFSAFRTHASATRFVLCLVVMVLHDSIVTRPLDAGQ